MSTAYDNVVYPNRSLPQTNPARLGVLGFLFGLTPAAPQNCRVLELGCGDGSNLLPLAYTQPRSQFFGIDLAANPIAAGQQAVAELGLTNLHLQQGDLTAFPVAGETFDYIIAHGVYSWVPLTVRDALLAICRGRLAPHGIAYISYNCMPGCHIRRMVREIMRFHVRGIENPQERVRQAVAVCGMIAKSIERPDTYRRLFQEQLEQVERFGEGHLYHDDLAEINEPSYFHEFVAHAASHGLQFLAEADFCEMQEHAFNPEARRILHNMEDSRVTREQYLDFIKCRRFRQTLLCHHETPVRNSADPSPIPRFFVGSDAEPESANPELDSRKPERYVMREGGRALVIDYPLAKAAFHILREKWPAMLSFDELFQGARALLSETSEPSATDIRGTLAGILLECYRAGVVEFRTPPVHCVGQASSRPAVWQFARWQIQRSSVITTLRGGNLRVEDDEGRTLLQLLDGTRRIEEIEPALPFTREGSGGADRMRTRIQELARLSLLEP